MERLQGQLDQLKFKIFKINQITHGSLQGLVGSGVTYPLRPRRLGKGDETYKRGSIMLANEETISLQVTPGGIMVIERADVESILPMGYFVHDLDCEICWKNGNLKILCLHRCLLPVQN